MSRPATIVTPSTTSSGPVAEKPLVFLTGATGFIGSHILAQLLAEGEYRVRINVRPGKRVSIDDVNLQVVEVEDMCTADFEGLGLFQGVHALLHVATPVYAEGVTSEDIYQGAITGLKNVVLSALKAGVKKVIYTSSASALMEPDLSNAMKDQVLTEHSWSPLTDPSSIDTKTLSPPTVYFLVKAVAEKMFWQWSEMEEWKDVDFTTVVPSLTTGPWLRNQKSNNNNKDVKSLSSNIFIYTLLNGQYPPIPVSNWTDVRDITQVHIQALKTDPLPPPTNRVVKKRLLVETEQYTWSRAVEIIREKRPHLGERLPPKEGGGEGGPPSRMTVARMDTGLMEEVTGLKKEMFVKFEDSLIEVVDELIEWEKVRE